VKRERDVDAVVDRAQAFPVELPEARIWAPDPATAATSRARRSSSPTSPGTTR
jgi:hypothetical protein